MTPFLVLALLCVADEVVPPATPALPAAAAAASTPSPPPSLLDEALSSLAAGEVDAALTKLEAVRGPLTHAQLVAKYQGLGIARATAGDAAGAEQAFRVLLTLAPTHALAYTLSPQATFPFERARRALASAPALEAELLLPPPAPWGAPLPIDVELTADPLRLVHTFTLCHGVKGGPPPSCQELPAPPPGQRVSVKLPALDRPADATEGAGVFVQVSLRGFDGERSEVWRGPTPERPAELGVGFAPPEPWTASPWLWGTVGGVAAAVATAAAVGTWLALRPTTQTLVAQPVEQQQ